MTNPNLKIPLALIQKYKLSTLTLLVYGELNGLYSKYHKCDITDNELAKRLNRSIASIQRSIHDLKKSKLISSKQKANYKGRSIKVAQVNDKKYILIPISIIRDKDLSQNALLVYGSLYSRLQKQIKINNDKKIHDINPSFIISKTEIAQELNKTTRTIGRAIKELVSKNYIMFNSINGVGIEINLPSFACGKLQKLGQKREATYDKNEHPPMTKMRSQLGQKRATNKVLININKETHFHSSSSNKDLVGVHTALEEFLLNPLVTPDDLSTLANPIYYEALPKEIDIPPIPVTPERVKDIYELNKLDAEQNTSPPPKTRKYNNTAKSGSEKGKEIAPYNSASKVKTDQTSNNKDAQSVKEEINYIAYNGFNIDYQCKTLQHILRRYTGKNYIISFNQISLLKKQLDSGLTLYDFESAIDYLIQQGKTISIKDLANNLPNYLSKTNSN